MLKLLFLFFITTSAFCQVQVLLGINPNNGPTSGGTAVTLYGSNFGMSPSVYFGTQTASIAFSSSTTIRVTSPSQSNYGIYNVYVKSGPNLSNAIQYTYSGSASPVPTNTPTFTFTPNVTNTPTQTPAPGSVQVALFANPGNLRNPYTAQNAFTVYPWLFGTSTYDEFTDSPAGTFNNINGLLLSTDLYNQNYIGFTNSTNLSLSAASTISIYSTTGTFFYDNGLGFGVQMNEPLNMLNNPVTNISSVYASLYYASLTPGINATNPQNGVFKGGILIGTSTPTFTVTNTPTGSATPTKTNTPTNTVTNTPTNTITNTPTNSPTNTPTNTPTLIPTVVLGNQGAAVTYSQAGIAYIVPSPTWTPVATAINTFTPLPTVFITNQSAVQLGSGQIVVSPTWTPVPIPTMLVPIATPYVANGTVTIQPGILWIEGWLVGGGAGGWGGGNSQGTSPGNGGNTVFALSSPITCNGGVTATAWNSGTGGLGGSFTIGTSVSAQGVTGGIGGSTQYNNTLNSIFTGGFGGHGAFGNSGAGGAGGFTDGSSENSGPGGGGGGGVHFFWAVTPGATVPITIGGAGSGGGAGGSGLVGLVGQPGSALIIQHYN
jgi:hypothetical protein